ncbi:hypothetical protein ACHQM5_001738 [Ranunculus cassubicifolius]
MVWFQCDCGEDLKKPKVPKHLNMCYGNKLSCLDCGETFSRDTVLSHTQCITEAEKYGPKGQGKTSNGTPAKTNSDAKKKPDVDINVGLSSWHPWTCSLCKTTATSKQTLLLHADGKKHRAKARAYHASKQPPPPKETTELASNTQALAGEVSKEGESVSNKAEETKLKSTSAHTETQIETMPLEKKRKAQDSDDLSNGEVIQGKKAKQGEKIKWKKLISSALKSSSDGVMKLRKLQKLVSKSLEESGQTEDEDKLKEKLMKKIDSSSKFTLDHKLVRLVAKT